MGAKELGEGKQKQAEIREGAAEEAYVVGLMSHSPLPLPRSTANYASTLLGSRRSGGLKKCPHQAKRQWGHS